MPNDRTGALAALGAAIAGSAFLAILDIAMAHGSPAPDFCTPPASIIESVCTARLTTVTANTIDGTITGPPIGGATPLTLSGQSDAYLKSGGFAGPPPDPVQAWDDAIDRVNSADPSGPDGYGNAKARAFLPRTLDDLATKFRRNTIVVRFVPDDANPGWFRLVSIQPMAE